MRETPVFLSGRFNRHQQDVPLVAWRQALAEFCDTVLQEDAARREGWTRDLLEAVDGQGQLLVQLVPEFEKLLGPQPKLDAGGPEEARQRFVRVIRDALGVICQPEHPMVLFMDDWQWADPASVYLLSNLELDTTLRYMLVVAAFRSDAEGSGGEFERSMGEIRSQQTPITEMRADCLSESALTDLVSSKSELRSKGATELASRIYSVTKGNVFFAHTLLDELGRADGELHDADGSPLDLPTSISGLFDRRMKRLTPKTRELLVLAAWLGSQFEIGILANLGRMSPSECEQALSVGADFLVPLGDSLSLGSVNKSYQFVHDHAQQAARSFVTAEEQPLLRLTIAQTMLADLEDVDLEERLCEVASHFNAGAALLETDADLWVGVELNVRAARKAIGATAFRSALEFHRTAQTLIGLANPWASPSPDVLERDLPQEAWAEHYDLIFSLLLEHAETEFLEGSHAKAERLIRCAVDKARTSIERAEALTALVVQHTVLGRYTDAIAAGREALAALEMSLPVDSYEAARDAAIAEVRQRMSRLSVSNVLKMPAAHDERVRVAAKVYIAMAAPCYRAQQGLWSVIVPRVVKLTLEHGPTPRGWLWLCRLRGAAQLGFERFVVGAGLLRGR